MIGKMEKKMNFNEYKEKRKKSTKKDFIRVKYGYICPFDRFMRLVEVKKG